MLTVCFLALSAVSAPLAHGQQTEDAKTRARAAYARGQQLYASGNYQEAELSFQEAFATVPNPLVLLSIAETQKKLDHPVDAVATLERYLDLKPDAANRPEIEKRIKELKDSPGTLSANSDPPGAVIRLDGIDIGKTTPAEFKLPPGTHEVTFSLPGRAPVTQKVDIQFGAHQELQATLGAASTVNPFESAGGAEQNTSSPEDHETGGGTTINWAAWSVAGVGVIALITGVTTGAMALGAKSDFNKNPTDSAADKTERLGLIADISFAVAGVAAIGATMLWLTMDNGAAENGGTSGAVSEVDKQKLRLEFAPAISPSYSGISTALHF